MLVHISKHGSVACAQPTTSTGVESDILKAELAVRPPLSVIFIVQFLRVPEPKKPDCVYELDVNTFIVPFGLCDNSISFIVAPPIGFVTLPGVINDLFCESAVPFTAVTLPIL